MAGLGHEPPLEDRAVGAARADEQLLLRGLALVLGRVGVGLGEVRVRVRIRVRVGFGEIGVGAGAGVIFRVRVRVRVRVGVGLGEVPARDEPLDVGDVRRVPGYG